MLGFLRLVAGDAETGWPSLLCVLFGEIRLSDCLQYEGTKRRDESKNANSSTPSCFEKDGPSEGGHGPPSKVGDR